MGMFLNSSSSVWVYRVYSWTCAWIVAVDLGLYCSFKYMFLHSSSLIWVYTISSRTCAWIVAVWSGSTLSFHGLVSDKKQFDLGLHCFFMDNWWNINNVTWVYTASSWTSNGKLEVWSGYTLFDLGLYSFFMGLCLNSSSLIWAYTVTKWVSAWIVAFWPTLFLYGHVPE